MYGGAVLMVTAVAVVTAAKKIEGAMLESKVLEMKMAVAVVAIAGQL